MARQMQKTSVPNQVQFDDKSESKRTFSQSDGVNCVSITHGTLNVAGPKTGMIYRFSDYGDTTEIEYRDLVAMIRSKDKAVYEPRFVVEDDDFIAEYPAIKKFYDDEFS